MRLVITGSRTIRSYDRFERAMDYFLGKHGIPLGCLIIVEGCAWGIDRSAERWALERDLQIDHHPAKYYTSPLIRNQAMVNEADAVLALWDGVSRGTKYTVNYARTMGRIPVFAYRMQPDSAAPQPRLKKPTSGRGTRRKPSI